MKVFAEFQNLNGQLYKLKDTELKVYREEGSPVVIVDTEDGDRIPVSHDGRVSRKSSCKRGYHARLARVNDEWVVEDGGSLNGTYVAQNPEGLPYVEFGNPGRKPYSIDLKNFLPFLDTNKDEVVTRKEIDLAVFVGSRDVRIDLKVRR